MGAEDTVSASFLPSPITISIRTMLVQIQQGAIMSDVQETIRGQVEGNPVILYMKGSPQFPQCGFSMRAAQALAGCGVEFAYVNVLDDEDIRQGVKEFGDWPTIPQLYVGGELLGGCDIILEMYESGDLEKAVKAAGASEPS
jgi:monothiol glutaredoxin